MRAAVVGAAMAALPLLGGCADQAAYYEAAVSIEQARARAVEARMTAVLAAMERAGGTVTVADDVALAVALGSLVGGGGAARARGPAIQPPRDPAVDALRAVVPLVSAAVPWLAVADIATTALDRPTYSLTSQGDMWDIWDQAIMDDSPWAAQTMQPWQAAPAWPPEYMMPEAAPEPVPAEPVP